VQRARHLLRVAPLRKTFWRPALYHAAGRLDRPAAERPALHPMRPPQARWGRRHGAAAGPRREAAAGPLDALDARSRAPRARVDAITSEPL